MALKVGTLFVSFVARTKAFEDGINRAKARVSTFATGIGKAQNFTRVFGATLATLGATRVLGFSREVLRNIDAQAKLARSLGISQQSLAAFQIAGEQAGVSVEQVNKSLGFFSKTLGETTTGISTEGKLGFGALKIQIEELQGLKPEEAFLKTADALQKFTGTASERSAIVRRLFGRQSELVNFLNTGPARFRELQMAAQQFGLGFNENMTKPVEELNDALLELTLTVKGLVNQLAVTGAPQAIARVRRLTPKVLPTDASMFDRFTNSLMFRAAREVGSLTTPAIVGRATGLTGENGRIERVLIQIREALSRDGIKTVQ